MSRAPEPTSPPLSSTRPVAALAIRAQPVGTGPAPKTGIWPENVSFTT
ncbi:hypothetical protein [Saccharothrix sp. ALI-22-I]|nr:hypothetical protein [Saccharothrix sp. ALI-22-I]